MILRLVVMYGNRDDVSSSVRLTVYLLMTPFLCILSGGCHWMTSVVASDG